MGVQHLTEEASARIASGTPYGSKHDPFTLGYRTKGGSFIIASNGRQNDVQKPRDLLLILPAPLVRDPEPTRVVVLTPLVNPDFVATVRALVD